MGSKHVADELLSSSTWLIIRLSQLMPWLVLLVPELPLKVPAESLLQAIRIRAVSSSNPWSP